MESEYTEIKSTSERCFDSVIFLFRLGGIPFQMKKRSTVYAVYMRIVILCACTSYVGMFADAYVHRDNLRLAMTNIRMLIPVTNAIWIYFYCRLRKQSIERALDLAESFTWTDLPTRDPDTGHLTAAGWIPLLKMFSTRVPLALMSFHILQSSIRIVTSHETFFTTWYPFDWTVSPFYELVNISECLASLLVTGVALGFLFLCTTLITVACAQFQKLNAAILDIRQESVTPQHKRYNEQVHNINNRNLHAKLNACIRHHQEIMALMQQLEDALSIGVCGSFLILLATMCFAAFSVVTNWGDYADMSQALVVYASYASFVLLTCWFGTQLTQHAASVRDAAFGCDWVGTPVPFQRCLMFIIATANREFQLTAGKFVPVSNVTMLNIMQETMSFFMFLLHVRDKNEVTIQG